MRVKKILAASLVTVSFICVVLVVVQLRERNKMRDYIKMADRVFRSDFSLLCNNLNKSESEEVNEENIKRAYVCFSIFSLTSFSNEYDLNRIVHRLYELSGEKALYRELDKSTIEKLNRLGHDPHNDALLKEIYDDFFN